MANNQSKQCKIVNNSGRDIMIALAISSDEGNSSNAITAANGQLEILKTSSGSTVIKNGGSEIVILDRSYSADSGKTGYVTSYDLQICDSNWLYPITHLMVTQQTINDSPHFESQTVAAADGITSSAVSFYQTIAAYPDSQLAKNYIAALQSAKDSALENADGSPESSKAVRTAISDAMNQFFKSTQEYQQVTLADVVAVDNYYNNFPAIWAQYKDSMTYYLYGSDGITASFAGTLSFQKSGPINVSKLNGGFICTFIPATDPTDMNNTDVDTSKTVNLTYQGGLFSDDPRADIPKVGLRGTFLLKRFLTNDPLDSSVIAVVVGTINGSTCVGLDTPQQISESAQLNLMSTSVESQNAFIKYWDRLTDPQSMKDWAVTILTFAGAVLLIPAIAFAVYQVYKAVTYKPPSKQAVEDGFNAPVDAAKKEGIKWQGNDEADIAEHYGLSIDVATEIAAKGMISQALAGAFSIQKTSMKEMLEYMSLMSPTDVDNLQSLLSEIGDSELAATKFVDETVYTQPDTLPNRIKAMRLEMAKISDYTGRFDSIYKKVQHKMSADSKELIDESAAQVSDLVADLEREMDKENDEASDVDPKIENEIEPVEIV